MKYLSICSGIEAATVAWHTLGWQPLAFSEIEPFPSAVLAHHWPDVQNLGDMTKHNEWRTIRPNIIVGGTPCQAFSVAGLRKGLADPRGNLTLTFLAIVAQHRPTWVVWENVPGVLSDRTGAFGSFLGGLAELGYGWAYRVLDAQYFGVAQRRRRVFVVGCAGGWGRSAAVLFERESLRGDSPPRRKTRQGASAGFECGPQGGDFTDVAPTLDTRCKDGPIRNQLGAGVMVPDVAGCLTARDSKGADSDTKPGHFIPVAFSGRARGDDGRGYDRPPQVFECGVVGTIDTVKPHCVAGLTTAVRRLTPTECERLQGFPDNHTLIPWRNKPADQCPDGPRYKAIGNSMAVPVMRWIGERIQLIHNP